MCMQLISSSYNNVKTIHVNPVPVIELDEHKIQKNSKSHLFCRAANVYRVGPKTKE